MTQLSFSHNVAYEKTAVWSSGLLPQAPVLILQETMTPLLDSAQFGIDTMCG